MPTGYKPLLTLNLPAAAAISADRLFGYIDSSGQLALSGAGGPADGCTGTVQCTAQGDMVSLEVGPYLLVSAGGTIAIGDEVGSDANSKAVVYVSGKKLGKAVTAGATGGKVLIKSYTSAAQVDGDVGILSADGAVTIPSNNKTFFITKAGVAALTLANPTSGTHDGVELTFMSVTANAHTLSNAAGAGFNAGGAASDIGTYAAAKGNSLTVVAYQGVWYVKANTGVTLA